MRKFIIVWLGQIVSFIGSDLTSFAVGIWVYQKTGSVTQLSLISLFILLPGIIVAPVAGALVDRWNRRVCMIISDCGAMSCSIATALLITLGKLEVWHIYLAITLSSVFNTFGNLAYTANIYLLVRPDVQGRVFAVRRALTLASRPLAYLVAGLLADKVFEPLMSENGVLAKNIGLIIGVGKGRGIGLLFIITGILTITSTVVAYQYPRLRLIEKELSDVI